MSDFRGSGDLFWLVKWIYKIAELVMLVSNIQRCCTSSLEKVAEPTAFVLVVEKLLFVCGLNDEPYIPLYS
jgi:hypothetical protein